MKKNYAIFGSALMVAVSALTANAQQLPNAGFEEGWGACKPWVPKNNAKETGTTPSPWTISQVGGIGTAGTGATVVGEKCEGYNSTSAVKLYNSPNSLVKAQTVPGYVTLGTTWSTAQGIMANNKDGGTFGGIEFAYRPDAVSFMYTRSHGTANPNEPATVVAYLWKGTYTQANVPADISLSTPSKVNMIDRERNILGMTTDQGGEVTKTDDAACIAKIDCSIPGDASEWTPKFIEFNYLTNDTPEKFNIIFAAGNYWSTDLGQGNTLCVDDVKLIYYSRLAGVKVNGSDVPAFAPDTYEYTMAVETPASADAISHELLGKAKGSTVKVDLDKTNNKALLTVTNAAGNDIDGKASHVYTINFAAKPDPSNASVYEGKLVIEMGGGVINEGDETKYSVYITPTTAGHCDFSLPNFSLDLGGGAENLGDITVENCTMTHNADGTTSYSGHKDNLTLSLGGEPIVANVDLTGTESATGALKMTINVAWLYEGSEIPIDVTFNGQKKSTGVADITIGEEDAPVEYYNLQGIRVNNPESGVYIRRQGNTVSKVLVK